MKFYQEFGGYDLQKRNAHAKLLCIHISRNLRSQVLLVLGGYSQSWATLPPAISRRSSGGGYRCSWVQSSTAPSTQELFSWSHQAAVPVRLDTAVHLKFDRIIRKAPLLTRKGIDTTRFCKNPARASYTAVQGPYGPLAAPTRTVYGLFMISKPVRGR